MPSLSDLLLQLLDRVLDTLEHTWPYLVLSIVLASAIQVYVGTDRLGGWLRRSSPVAVLGAVALGALTPFCSCGTMAVVLGSLAAAVPWAPIVAFLASSPLTSPGELALSVGLFGPGFAVTFFVAAIGVGLLGGLAAWLLERLGWLVGQGRVNAAPKGEVAAQVPCCAWALTDAEPVGAGGTVLMTTGGPGGGAACGTDGSWGTTTAASCGCGTDAAGEASPSRADQHREFGRAVVANGRTLLLFFLAFTALGYLLIGLIPSSVFEQHLGAGNAQTAVPLAALLGIPVYLNTDGSLPLIASLMDGGMGAGPALAFLITGAGTSVGAVSGMLLVARWRVVALVVATLFVSACLTGWLAPLWLG